MDRSGFEFRASDLMAAQTINVRLTGVRWIEFRLRAAAAVIRLAIFLAGAKSRVEVEIVGRDDR